MMCYFGFKEADKILMCSHSSKEQRFILLIGGNSSLGSMGEGENCI